MALQLLRLSQLFASDIHLNKFFTEKLVFSKKKRIFVFKKKKLFWNIIYFINLNNANETKQGKYKTNGADLNLFTFSAVGDDVPCMRRIGHTKEI